MTDYLKEKSITADALSKLQNTAQTTVWWLADALEGIAQWLNGGKLSQADAAQQLAKAATTFRESWFYTATAENPTGLGRRKGD